MTNPPNTEAEAREPIEITLTESELRDLRELALKDHRAAELRAMAVENLVMGLAAHLSEAAYKDVSERCQKVVKAIDRDSGSAIQSLFWEILPLKGYRIEHDFDGTFKFSPVSEAPQ